MASDLLILVLIWSVSVCLCQRDCSGVKCPELSNCMDEVLDPGACCAKCVQTGCMCEGYQYYDCLSAGFRNGKVPEGESYFVDFGSTECSCPQGGGRISCHFIPCPEIPANCIEMSEPADGCIQCGRVGCVHEEQKYDAGHSFQIDPCQVCHCPNDGGSLMCYPIPDCDPSQVPKTMLMTPGSTEDNQAARHRDPRQHVLHGQIPRIPFTKHLPDLHRDSDRSFKPHQSHSVGDEENDEDYDYPPTDSPAESSIIPLSDSDNFSPWQAVHKPAKQELRERFAIHRSTTDRPRLPFHKDAVERMSVDVHRDKARNEKFGALKFKTNSEPFVYPVEATNRVGFSARQDEVQSFSLYKENSEQDDNEQLELSEETADGVLDVSQEDTTYSEAATDSPMSAEITTSPFWKTTSSWQARWDQETQSHIQSHLPNTLETDTSKEDAEDKVDEGEPDAAPKDPIDAAQPITEEQENVLINSGLSVSHTNETSSEHKASQSFEEPEMVSVDRRESVTLLDLPFGSESWQHHASTEKNYDWQFFTSPAPIIPSHSLINMREEPEKNSSHTLNVGSEEGLMENCCMAGQKWAEENQHCDQMPGQTEDLNSVCLVVQQQCCSGALRENKCQAGINMAKSGHECEETSPNCGEDSRKDCCSCCALGLRLQREGEGCHLHQHLSYPCGHVFLICCEEGEEELAPPKLQKKPRPAPTLLPKRESDRQLLKQALSVGDVDPAANSLEDLESVDRCQRFAALCHHTCINTPDSYRCSCHPGFKLLQDARTCVPENQEEDNRVGEEDGLITEDPTNQESPTEAPVRHYPCAGNGPCSHHCSEVRGQAQCSCFPGFSLAADKHTCEDVNECVTDAQPCQANQRCVNTMGAFVCERQASCQSGYQRRNGACEDIDECLIHTHTCKMGFQCQNTDGSFMCKPKQQCLAGFSKDLHGNCIDVDECDSLSEPCTTGFNCINTVGSYTCQRKIIMCGRGYHSSPDGARCIDEDECQTGSHRCGEGQICHNLPGSHRCDCHTGYQYDAIRKLCVDVNECWRYPGRLCAQTCENTPGSYECSCTTGFSLTFDGKNCEDLNECEGNPCSQECANIYGSYQCYCRVGFFLKEDGHTCEDIDECSQSIGNLCAFQCVNILGSYKCACPPTGYSMSPNGRTCQDIDECSTGTHNCSGSETCFNIQGGFRCLSFTCPENYRRVSDTRCERTSCPNFQQCQTMPLRITYYQLSFQTNIVIPAQIFRIGPSPAYAGDNIIISIPRGNEEAFFSTRKLNSFTGAVYLHRQVGEPRDFLIDVEMKLLRQGTFTTFLARIYVFITADSM